jgi:centromere protein X
MPPKAFKPPRPSTSHISKTTKPKSGIAQKSTGSTTKSISKAKPKERSKSNGFKVPRLSGLPSLSPDTEPEDDDDPFASDADSTLPNNKYKNSPETIEIDSSQEQEDAQVEEEEEERRESIPPDLLTRLLHENFKEEGTRLSKDASKAVGKYMETFVREALARAAFARVEIEERSGRADGFLEVEDLEKEAPQLLMDF